MPSQDITFCISRECPKKKSCGRNTCNNDLEGSHISMANLYEKNKKCGYKLPKG